jgi:hypothetical protein
MLGPIVVAAYFLIPWETHHWWAQRRLTGQEADDIIPVPATSTVDNGSMKNAPAFDTTTATPAFVEEDKEGESASNQLKDGYTVTAAVDIEAGSDSHQQLGNSAAMRGDGDSDEESDTGIRPPELVNPLSLLVYLLEWEIAPTYWFAGTAFAA